MRTISLKVSILVLAVTFPLGAYPAESASSLTEAVRGGNIALKFRYRFEHVDQDDFTRVAKASTLRTRLVYQTLEYRNISALLEFDNLAEIGADDYNDGTGRRPEFPVVADATYTEVNQAYLDVKALPGTLVRVGRQRVNLDNERFVGGVGWRQNEQTFDAFAIVNSSIRNTGILFAAVTDIKRISGGSLDLGTHKIFHVSSTLIPYANLSAYGYLLDNVNDSYGLRLTQRAGSNLIYTFEYAYQRTPASTILAASHSEADYLMLEGGMKFATALAPLTAKVSYEVLGSDNGNYGFSTPVATLHPHNGWADKFLTTPSDGLIDFHFTLETMLRDISLKAVYHDFETDEGDVDLGHELDAIASKAINENLSIAVKYAWYKSGDRASITDTRKIWFMANASF